MGKPKLEFGPVKSKYLAIEMLEYSMHRDKAVSLMNLLSKKG